VRPQRRRRRAKVSARRCLDTVIAVAQVHRIQVRAEDFVLAIALLEPGRERRFADLARERPRGRELLGARELLRDGARPFHDPSGAPVPPCGLDDADAVQAVVRIEAPVLRRNNRVDHVRRHRVDRHVDALL
jgi:hypothetical protein